MAIQVQELLCCEYQTRSYSCLDFLTNGTSRAIMEAQIETKRWFCARGRPILRSRISKKSFSTRRAHEARWGTTILLPTLLSKDKEAPKVEILVLILSTLVQNLFVSSTLHILDTYSSWWFPTRIAYSHTSTLSLRISDTRRLPTIL